MPGRHGPRSWNSIIQRFFDKATKDANATFWTGESGVLSALVLLVLALPVMAVRLPMWRTPVQRFDH